MNPHQILIKEAAAQFPTDFGLRAFPGLEFYIDKSASYVISDSVILYVFTSKGLDFCKSTPEALLKEVVSLKKG